jgi:hypothetical protein
MNLPSSSHHFRFIGIHSKKQTTPDEVNLYLQDKNIRFDVFNDPDLNNR